MSATPRKLWQHEDPRSTPMWHFMNHLTSRHGVTLETFTELHHFSTTRRNDFWTTAMHYFPIIYEGRVTKAVEESASITDLPNWFEGVRINFAENLLYTRVAGRPSKRCVAGKEDDKLAVVEMREAGVNRQQITWAELRTAVAKLARAMQKAGVQAGDVIAAVASSSSDTLKVFLASTALGAVFTSSSPEMGATALLERLTQVKPKVIFMDDSTMYNGKSTNLREKIAVLAKAMSSITGFRCIVSQPQSKQPLPVSELDQVVTLDTFLLSAASENPALDIPFERVDFNAPCLIVYSSGTTGTPKCIVHKAGSMILNSYKENMLHRSMTPLSVSMTYTTTAWIMYAALVMHMIVGAQVVFYDGSPMQPAVTTFLEIAADEKVTHFGTGPRYLLEIQRLGYRPRDVLDLSHLQEVGCTGMVLSIALFEWFYDVGFPQQVHLHNFSGGTDIAGSFAGGNPLDPLYAGGMQGPNLGTAIAIYDPAQEGNNITGFPVADGTPGELVATASFPNVPWGFWGDTDNRRFRASYFERFNCCWTHGDLIERHPITKQIIFLGRSDGVLNPSGVRFGSAEIYSVLENTFPTIQDSVCVGQRRLQDNDERVLLFALMKPGERLTDALVSKIKGEVGRQLSKRHIPAFVFATPEIPTTANGKKVELPVKRIVSGQDVKPSATIINPQSLSFYKKFCDIEKFANPVSKL